jgi:glutathione synthase/RimK-type ligase-like ATP-grasp enzyme
MIGDPNVNQGKAGPVAIATCSAVAGKETEDLRLIKALAGRGIPAVHAAWDDPLVDWHLFPLVVVRSTWDYPERRGEFLSWSKGLRKVLNPHPVLEWNTDKRYLNDLARAGVPVIPTLFLDPGDAFDAPTGAYVIKPAVSCGAKQTARYEAGPHAEAREHVRALHAAGRTVMVQPYLSDIEASGEVALVFIGGEYSHSVRRGALLKAAGVRHKGEMVALNIEPYEATATERQLAEKALAALPFGTRELLYARVDLAPSRGGEPLVLEVELTEPSLFLEYHRQSFERLAACIAEVHTKT